MLDRENAANYISFVADDAGAGWDISSREFIDSPTFQSAKDLAANPKVRLVGWQCGFEPLFVAVRSYLPDTNIDEEEAEELAINFLNEKLGVVFRRLGRQRTRRPDFIL
jgi:hypothetical protein